MIDYKDLGSKKSVKQKNSKSRWKIALVVFVLLFVAGVFSALAYFYVGYTNKHYVLKYVAITGNKVLSVRQIKKLAELDKTGSMYDYSEKSIYSKLMLNPWIKKAYVAKLYPDTIYVKIMEWIPEGLIVSGKKKLIVGENGNVIDAYKKGLNVDISKLPRIVVTSPNYIKDFLIRSIINIYEKLDKFGKINYIEVISDSYQLVHFNNSLNIAVNSLNCPNKAFVHLQKEWGSLVSERGKLDSVSICFDNKFVLRWKKEKKGGGN